MRYKLVIFDFDGTLADSFQWFLRVINSVADKYKFKHIEPHETEMLRSLGARQIVRHLGVPTWKMPLIANHMRKLKARQLDETKPFGGVHEMLRTLSDRGVKIAVVSSNSEANVRAILGPDNAGLISCYDCGASIFGKARRFRSVLRRTGVSPDQAICIGDEIRDHEAARDADIAFGAVAWGYTIPDALAAQQPSVMFWRIDEITQKLG